MTAAAVMKAENATRVAFSRMLDGQKAKALEALTTQVAQAGGAPGLVAHLAGQLRRAVDGALFVELELPRLSFYPSSAWIGQGFFEQWSLDLITKPHPDGLGVQDAFWLSVVTTILPLAEAVALVSGPDSPIAEIDRRRAEVERRRKEAAAAGAIAHAERERAEAADRDWMNKNAGRIRRWVELPELFRSLAAAAGESGDATLQAFVAAVIEFDRTRNVQQVRPPDFLWPLSG